MSLGSSLYNARKKSGLSQDIDLKEIEQIIENSNEEKQNNIDWSSAWSKKYPILATYLSLDGIEKYSAQIENICKKVKAEFDFSELDTFLVVKDIVYRIYKKQNEKDNRVFEAYLSEFGQNIMDQFNSDLVDFASPIFNKLSDEEFNQLFLHLKTLNKACGLE